VKYPWIEDFLRLRDLDSEAKCVYLAACLEPMSLADLGRATGLSRNCIKARVRSLVKAGWIEVRADGRKKLALPTAPQAVQQKYAEILKVRLSMAMYRGEAQMKLLLDTSWCPGTSSKSEAGLPQEPCSRNSTSRSTVSTRSRRL
jgi:biotin operon repressor